MNGERVLHRFGPLGIGVTRARPALFTVTRQNCTEIVVTDRRTYGIQRRASIFFLRRRSTGKTVFDVPHASVTSVERADYLALHALWIRYREGDEDKGVGIEAGLAWRGHIAELEKLLAERTG